MRCNDVKCHYHYTYCGSAVRPCSSRFTMHNNWTPKRPRLKHPVRGAEPLLVLDQWKFFSRQTENLRILLNLLLCCVKWSSSSSHRLRRLLLPRPRRPVVGSQRSRATCSVFAGKTNEGQGRCRQLPPRCDPTSDGDNIVLKGVFVLSTSGRSCSILESVRKDVEGFFGACRCNCICQCCSACFVAARAMVACFVAARACVHGFVPALVPPFSRARC